MSENECTKSSPKQALQPSCRQGTAAAGGPAESGIAGQNDLPVSKLWYVYLVRAENGSLYCGITLDPQRRLQQHRSGKGARFFYSSPALDMVYLEECADKGSALKREVAIKRLTKQQKEQLAGGGLLEQQGKRPTARSANMAASPLCSGCLPDELYIASGFLRPVECR